MNRARLTFEVAVWEFTRFYKLKNELKGAAYMIIFGTAAFIVMFLIGRGATHQPDIVLINDDTILVDSTLYDHFNVLYGDIGEIDSWKIKLSDGDIDGLIVIHTINKGDLHLRSERPWMLQLDQIFNSSRRQSVIRQADIPAEIIERVTQSFTLNRIFYDERGTEGRGAERGFAIGFIVMMLVAVFIGFAYQFTAITGEKQQRITEQIVSAISPQTWIDGKILGITAVGIATIVFYGTLVTFLGMVYAHYFGAGFLAIVLFVNVWNILAFLLLALLGVLLWNSFFAAIAATISDPNSSERGALMFLPIIPVGFAFGALLNPDSLIIKILGIFPLTSSSMLPARMVLTEVSGIEFLLAFLFLLAAIWMFRKAAGKIFSFGMLMYGKEPGMKEMWRWIREA